MKKYFTKHKNRYITSLAILIIFSIIGIGIISKEYSSRTITSANGSEIKIKSKYGHLEKPDIIINPRGDSFVVWQDKSSNYGYDVYMQRFNKRGVPVGGAKRINQYRVNDQKEAKIAMDQKGNFVIVWQSYKQDGSGSGVYGQRFNMYGGKVRSEFKVNTYVPGNQTKPSIAMSNNGEFVIAWESEKQDKSAKSIFAQKFDNKNKKIDKEFQVNTNKIGTQSNSKIDIDRQKNFMIIWQSQKGDESWDIYGKTFKWKGENEDEDMCINTIKELNQENPDIISTGVKRFMVVWENTGTHEILKTKVQNIKGQIIYNKRKSGSEFEITESIFGHQKSPNIMKTEQNNVIIAMVVWQNFNKFKDGRGWYVMGKVLDKTGEPISTPIIVSDNNNEWHKTPSVGVSNKGDVNVVWSSYDKNDKKKSINLKVYNVN